MTAGVRPPHRSLDHPEEQLQQLLARYTQQPLPAEQAHRFAAYLELLQRWNAKVNLTAIREPLDILQRHFLECIACARLLPCGIKTLLDYGSGAGFPGVPCAICRPEIRVTLVESQGKKAAFLQEAVRTLELDAIVHQCRVQDMGADKTFDVVTLRAVDYMPAACADAFLRVKVGGWLAVMSTRSSLPSVIEKLPGLGWHSPALVPGSEQRVLLLGKRIER